MNTLDTAIAAAFREFSADYLVKHSRANAFCERILARANELQDTLRAEAGEADAEDPCRLVRGQAHAWEKVVETLDAVMPDWNRADGSCAMDRACNVIRRLSAPNAAPAPVDEWRCFHCDERFTDEQSATLHFGATEMERPACTIDVAEYRRMVAMEARYAEEDADVHRAMRRMQGEHQQALRREEEAGYARGLRDSGRCPCAASKSKGEATAGERDGRWPAECDWPNAPFTVKDEPGEHNPCWLIMPGREMFSFAHHATNGIDQARAKFVADACNAAALTGEATLGDVGDAIWTLENHWPDAQQYVDVLKRALTRQQSDSAAPGAVDEVLDAMEHDACDLRLGRQWMNACDHYAKQLHAALAQPKPDGQQTIRFDFVHADGHEDCIVITHDEMRERYAAMRDAAHRSDGPRAGGESKVRLARIHTAKTDGSNENWLEVPAIMVGEYLAVHAGVAFNPESQSAVLDGDEFVVTHLPSGLRCAVSPYMKSALDAARALSALPVEWPTLRKADVASLPGDLRAQINVIRAAARVGGDIYPPDATAALTAAALPQGEE